MHSLRHTMSTSAADVVPDVERGLASSVPVPSEKRALQKKPSYAFTSASPDAAAANDDAIETHLFDIDSLWARESPILVEWRTGRASKRLRGLDPLKEAAMNLLASVRIYFRYLVTAEAWALSLVSVAATLFFILFEARGRRLAANVSWAFISFAIIFPLTNSLNETFKRREHALAYLADVKAYLLSYYHAHRDWDWGENGRAGLPENHLANVRLVVASLVVDMRDVLTAPSTTRQVHAHAMGTEQQERIVEMSRDMNARIWYFDRMSLAVEELKYVASPEGGRAHAAARDVRDARLGEPEAHQAVVRPSRRAPSRACTSSCTPSSGTLLRVSGGRRGGATRPRRRRRHDSVRVPPERATSLAMVGLFACGTAWRTPSSTPRSEPRGGTRKNAKRRGGQKEKGLRDGTREERKIFLQKANEPKGHGRGLDTRRAGIRRATRAVATEVVDADRNACGGGRALDVSDAARSGIKRGVESHAAGHHEHRRRAPSSEIAIDTLIEKRELF